MLIEILPTIIRSPCSAAADKEKKYADLFAPCLRQAGLCGFARITLYLPQPGYLELLSIYRLPSATL